MTQKRCCKCQSTITIPSSTSRHSSWCGQCFIDQLHIKFFQAFKIAREYCRPHPKNKQPFQNHASLVVHFENNLNSFVTLHLINHYLDTNQVRSTDKWKSPIDLNSIQVIWVNPGSAYKYLSTDSYAANTEEGEEEQKTVRSIVENLGYKLVILHLDDLFKTSSSTSDQSHRPSPRCLVDLSDPNLPMLEIDRSISHSRIIRNQKATLNEEDQSGTELEKLLRPLTKTSRKSLIEILTCITLINFCQQTSSDHPLPSSSVSQNQHNLNNNKVLIKSTSSTSLAIDTLLNVSLGNGFCLDQIVGPSSYIDDVLICRPIYQILDIEIVEYCRILNLPNPYNSLDRNRQDHQSIDNTSANSGKKVDNMTSLLTDFIKKLEENYPLTSSVINQTVNKIGKNKPDSGYTKSNSSQNKCRICLRLLDPQAHEWKKSITLSTHETRKTSTKEKQEEGSKSKESSSGKKARLEIELEEEAVTSLKEDNKGFAEVEMNDIAIVSLRNHICFGCLVTFTDHLYSFNPASSQGPVWIQLPDCVSLLSHHHSSIHSPLPAPTISNSSTSSHVDYLNDVLDEFLIKD